MKPRIISALLAAFVTLYFSTAAQAQEEGIRRPPVTAEEAEHVRALPPEQWQAERERLRERWQAMSPEERRALRHRMREREQALDLPPREREERRRALRERWRQMSPEERSRLQRDFDEAGRRGSGARSEACRADPQKCRGQAKARLEERFGKADGDGNGALSRDEARKEMPGLARRFDEIDANRDGRITRDEIQAAHEARAEKRGQRREEPPQSGERRDRP